MTSPASSDQHQRAIEASRDRAFSFAQGSSLHVGILQLALRPSGAHDEAAYFRGACSAGRSHGWLELGQVQPTAADDEPDVDVWFEPGRTMLDLSAAFADAPAEALAGSGIPAAVLNGPVSAERSGDAGDGVNMLLTRLCAGKMVVDPRAIAGLIASEHVVGFGEHEEVDDTPLRSFTATMSLHHLLAELGLSSAALINQIAMLGYDLRTNAGPEVVALFNEHLHNNVVQLGWFIDEHNRVSTVQLVIALTDFLTAVVSSDEMVERLASEENCSVAEMRAFVDESAEAGRLVYLNGIWQTLEDAGDAEVSWPIAEDLSQAMATQARSMQDASAQPDSPTTAAGADARQVIIDPRMIETMQASSGAMHFVLSEVDGDAAAAMQAAHEAVMTVRHPDEPTESLASFLSDVVETDSGAHFWADISDMEDEPEVLEEVLAAVAGAIAAHVTSALLSADPTAQ